MLITLNPVETFTTTGKKPITAAIITLLVNPSPNHKIKMGAMAIKGIDLKPIINGYERTYKLVKECLKITPFAMRGKLDQEICRKSSELLVNAKECETKALDNLSSVLSIF